MLMARWTTGIGTLALVAIGAASTVTGLSPGLAWALVLAGLGLASRVFRPDADGLGPLAPACHRVVPVSVAPFGGAAIQA
jgi:hypothetical protein